MRGKIARKKRHLLSIQQKFLCCYCRRRFTKDGPTRSTLEHKKPRRDGGGNEIGNLAVACYHCNQHRGKQINQARQSQAKKQGELSPLK